MQILMSKKGFLNKLCLGLGLLCSFANAQTTSETFQKLNVKHSISGLDLAKLHLNNYEFTVELAQTPQEQEIGLMNRLILPQNQGMLFVFPQVDTQTFWMKNTKIALDILYFDEQFKLVTIHHALPCLVDPCKVYQSSQPVKYVLELASGSIEKFSLKEGMNLVP